LIAASTPRPWRLTGYERTRWRARVLGLRFWNNEVLENVDSVLMLITEAVANRRAQP
jgi:very-short-patch-repair endonuclease